MLNYTKLILEKVSFDKNLFYKELKKSICYISQEEISKLEHWCYQRFGDMYKDLLDKVFRESLVLSTEE